jgi:hypothetical protein
MAKNNPTVGATHQVVGNGVNGMPMGSPVSMPAMTTTNLTPAPAQNLPVHKGPGGGDARPQSRPTSTPKS